jgi:hypothetical protein
LFLVKLLTSVMELAGTIGAAVILVNSGVCLAHAGNDSVGGLGHSANETTRILRSKMRLVLPTSDRSSMEHDGLEDVVLTFQKQYHLLRLLSVEGEEVFLYVVLDRRLANLAMTRHKVVEFEKQLFDDTLRVRLMQLRLRKERETAENENIRTHSEPESYVFEESEDELPAYLCEDSVRRMLGLAPIAVA